MIHHWWREVQKKFTLFVLDEYIVMPNHIHGIIQIKESSQNEKINISHVVQWFKTMTTNAYIPNGLQDANFKRSVIG